MPILQDVDIKFFKGVEQARLADCGPVNILIGKNNAGKSTLLHAIDMAGLTLTRGSWDHFEYKLEMKHLFNDAGPFQIDLTWQSGLRSTVSQQKGSFSPSTHHHDQGERRLSTILIVPEPNFGPYSRHHRTPKQVMDNIENREFRGFNGLDMLYAIKFYAERGERGLASSDYERLLAEIKSFFPDLESVESARTDADISTLTYREYGVSRDILYSGGGLKHFIDILVKITLSRANVVLLDEPENSLHPDLQRRLLDFLVEYARTRGAQFFVTTHSPALIRSEPDIRVFAVRNTKGRRAISAIPAESMRTAWSDLGFRPSDLLQRDINILVEGQSDVIFFETVLKVWSPHLKGISVGVQQYGGDAATAIANGRLDLGNVAPLNVHALWIHDRDAPPGDTPSKSARDIVSAVKAAGYEGHILDRREIEYYYPVALLEEAQGNDAGAKARANSAVSSPQTEKLRALAAANGFEVPGGHKLRTLLEKHLQEGSLADIGNLLPVLVSWRKEILGS